VSPPKWSGSHDAIPRWALPVATLIFFAATVRGYGVFRDELYYVACGRHLDWGYVDHPPLVAWIAAAVRGVFGASWIALRLVCAVAAAAMVLLVGETARVLGAEAWGRMLAQLLAATAPVYLSLFTIYSMNAFDVLIWAGLAWLAATLLAGGDPRLWLAFGLLAGVGLENKIDVAFLGVGLGAGILLARRFDLLRERRMWIGAGIAVLLFAPHLVWQQLHGWPTAEFVANAQREKIVRLGALRFLGAQGMMVGPVAALLAAVGLGWLLAARAARPFRPLGWAVLAVLGILVASVSKPYYFAPAWTVLFPAAGAALERWIPKRALRAVAVVAVLSVVAAAPLAKPLVSEDRYVRYASALGFAPSADENHRMGRLPQFFADMHGWREMAEAVARVVGTLPADERSRACVYGNNYGEAGAVDYYREELGLPPAISGHNSYWLWGPGPCTGAVMVIVGGDREDHLRNFATVEDAGTFRCADCMPYESDLTLWVARGLSVPLAQAWAGAKHYN